MIVHVLGMLAGIVRTKYRRVCTCLHVLHEYFCMRINFYLAELCNSKPGLALGGAWPPIQF